MDLNVGFHDWVVIETKGTTITEKQALEIAKRTDSFFKEIQPIKEAHKKVLESFGMKVPSAFKDNDLHFQWLENVRTAIDYLNLQNLSTDFVRNSGDMENQMNWFSLTGEIYKRMHIEHMNLDAEKIYEDLKKLVGAFPFLDFALQVSDYWGGYEEVPIIAFQVKDGIVQIIDPEKEDVFSEY